MREMYDKVLSTLEIICKDIEPGKKMLQKLVYLIERKGVDLGLEYRIHFYGPYSSDLDQLLHAFEANNYLDINTKGTTHKIKMKSRYKQKALSDEEIAIMKVIIERYASKTPLELEVLTTTDFVASDLKQNDELSDQKIIENVRKIKGTKFTEDEISKCISDLKEFGLIA